MNKKLSSVVAGAVALSMSMVASPVRQAQGGEAAGLTVALVITVYGIGATLALAAIGGSIASTVSTVKHAKKKKRQLLLQAQEDAVAYVANGGNEPTALLTQFFDLSREDLARTKGADVAAQLSNMDIANALLSPELARLLDSDE